MSERDLEKTIQQLKDALPKIELKIKYFENLADDLEDAFVVSAAKSDKEIYDMLMDKVAERNEMEKTIQQLGDTIMRVELPDPLQAGEQLEIEIDWSFPVPDRGRGGKELVDDGWIYEQAQWFPRVSVYDDVTGWQTEQFFGCIRSKLTV